MTHTYNDAKIVKHILDFCLDTYRFIFIAGNGGSGKTTLSTKLVTEAQSRGLTINCIDMDEFVIDTNIRKSAKKSWVDAHGHTRESPYTTSFKESYYLPVVESIIHSVLNNKDCYYKPKKSDAFVEVHASAPLTIIEGVGTAFLNKNELTYGVFMTCAHDVEIQRRIHRARNGEAAMSHEEVEKICHERNNQFQSIVMPEKNKFDLELQSLSDYSFQIIRDDLTVFPN